MLTVPVFRNAVFRSAAYRIAFLYSLAFAVTIALLGMATYLAADAALQRQRDEAIVAESRTLLAQAGPARRRLRDEINAREQADIPNPFAYALFDARGQHIAGLLSVARPVLGWSTLVYDDPAERGSQARVLAVRTPAGDRFVTAIGSSSIFQFERTILSLFALAFVGVVVLSGIAALLLGAYLRSRLGRISATARAIVSGDFTPRVPVGRGGDEFDTAAQALNAMLDRIASLMNNLRQVSNDIAHDLRTPLVRLRSRLEQAADPTLPAAQREEALAHAIDRSEQALALFAGLLRIAEVEGGQITRAFAPVDLSAVTADLGESFAPVFADEGYRFGWAVTPDLVVQGERQLLAQVGANLLENARSHTPIGTAIWLTLSGDERYVRLTVADHGPGVSEVDRARITGRFVRCEASRSTPGNGLGLSLVSAVTAAHGGTLSIDDNDPGLQVTIELPRAGATTRSPGQAITAA